MPRDNTGLYSRPSGTTAVSGALITDEIFNDSLDDIAAALTDSPRRAEVAAVAAATLTGGSAPSYTLALPTIATIGPDTAFSFRPHVTNPGTALAITGDLTLNSATVANVVIPAGIAVGQTVTSTTSGLPAKTTVLAFVITDTTTGKGNVTLSAAFTGTTTPAASLSLTPINPTMTLSGVAPGTFTGPLANNTKRMLAPDSTGIKAGELDPRLRYSAFYDVGRDAFIILGLGRISASQGDGRPGALYDKFAVADGSVLPIQTDPVTGEQKMILPSATLQVGDVLYSGRTITTGFLPCDGASYLQSAQSALFSAIGHAFATYNVGSLSNYPATNVQLDIFEYNTGLGRLFSFVGNNSNQIWAYLSSPDNGVTWTGTTQLYTGQFGVFAGAASSPTATVATGTFGSLGLAYCVTGPSTFTTASFGTQFSPGGMAYGAGMFVVVQGGSTVSGLRTSPDGVNWTARTLPVVVSNAKIAFANNTFVVVGDGGVVARSADGINWTVPASPGLPNTSGNVLLGSNNNFVLGQGSGTLYYTSADGVAWKTRQANNVIIPVCCMGGGWLFWVSSTKLLATWDFINHTNISGGSFTSIGAGTPNLAFIYPGTVQTSYNRATTFLVPNLPSVPAAYIKSA